MAEVVGFVIGLAGLFNAVVDDLEYVQFAHSFGADLQLSALQLSNAQLRLSRWGKSIGLGDVDGETRSLRGTLISEEDIEPTEKLLRDILAQLRLIKQKSAEYAKGKNPEDKSLKVYDPENVLGYSDLSLLEIGRSLVRRRRNGLLKKTKPKWVVYDRGHFKEMLDNVTKLTGELVELFPAAKVKEKELCDEEMTAFTGSLRQLQAAIANQDITLTTMLSQLLNPASETYNFGMQGGQVAQAGRNVGHVQQTVNNHR
ncbi:prion-inhibition and propagation-domain-containing protein [Cladorrhinum sp. PSN259]|nr:prion-inhibition and propagation-domain-containing protein [Cladorrhinum sp. PSN259]